MWCRATTSILLLVTILAACDVVPGAPTGLPATNPSLTAGQSVPYSLYTHCGILSLTANGHVYYTQPPLGDGSGNPPAGWGNPYDAGTITVLGAHRLEFHDSAGHKASFTDVPAGPTPTLFPCS